MSASRNCRTSALAWTRLATAAERSAQSAVEEALSLDLARAPDGRTSLSFKFDTSGSRLTYYDRSDEN